MLLLIFNWSIIDESNLNSKFLLKTNKYCYTKTKFLMKSRWAECFILKSIRIILWIELQTKFQPEQSYLSKVSRISIPSQVVCTTNCDNLLWKIEIYLLFSESTILVSSSSLLVRSHSSERIELRPASALSLRDFWVGNGEHFVKRSPLKIYWWQTRRPRRLNIWGRSLDSVTDHWIICGQCLHWEAENHLSLESWWKRRLKC